MSGLHLFLGGGDLEMQTIAALGLRTLGAARVHDFGLAWGARASAYLDEIRATLTQGQTPVLVELEDDLPADIDRARLIVVDHHGTRAGADRSSSLRQVFDLLGLPAADWTRREQLVEANDIGHMAALRAQGATAAEIRDIRDADRRAQGVSDEDEQEARRAIAAGEKRGKLTIVRVSTERTSPVGDFIEPEYGGPGAANLLVLTPAAAHFFGEGKVVVALHRDHDGWFGGALPARGFWGAPLAPGEVQSLVARLSALLD